MTSLQAILSDYRDFCKANANSAIVEKYSRYFKEGYDAWGVDNAINVEKRKEILPLLKPHSLNELIALGNQAWESGKYEEGMFAIWMAMSRKKEYTAENFQKLGAWLDNYIINWAHCDTLCCEVLYLHVLQNAVTLKDFDSWSTAPSIWKRRAVPVTWIKPLKKGAKLQPILDFLDPMMMYTEKPVQQGLGWFLREAWKIHPKEVEPFLLKWKDRCGRVIIQYATEKMTPEQKLDYKRIKK